jgi:hypothetical protein
MWCRAWGRSMMLIGLWACSGEHSGRGSRVYNPWTLLPDTGHSEIDGKALRKATLMGSGKEGREGSQRTDAVMLWLNCDQGSRTLSLLTDQPLEGSVQLRVKRDTLAPFTVDGFAGGYSSGGSRGSLILIPDAMAFVTKLEGHRRLLVEYAGRASSKTIAEFQLESLPTMRTQFEAVCAIP